MTYVDSTILNVALPAIERDLHASVSKLQWVLDAYLLVLASFLVLSGSIADRVGRRRVFCIGLLCFSLGSLLCSLAPDIDMLIVFRIIQALGGCMLTPVSLSIVRQVFTDPAERAQALGWWSCVFGLGAASGPILGGVLVSMIDWRSVFWVNVPVGLCAWVLARRYLPESRAAKPRRADPAGQLLITIALGSLTFALIEGPTRGWGSAAIVGTFSATVLATVALLVVQRCHPEPLFEPRFFRSPTFSAAISIAVLSFLVQSGFLFVNTLYLQQVRGDSALVAGVAVLPATAAIAVFGPPAGRLVARHGPRLPMTVAGLCLAGGSAVLLTLTPTTPYLVLALSYLLLGIGFGLINPPITNTAVNGMPAAQAGVASATVSTARQVGNALGVAIMGSLISGGAGDTRPSWILALGCGLACTAVAMVCTGPRAQRIADGVYRDIPE
jgi:EmrB/QacA subfamily drug resistance transporter